MLGHKILVPRRREGVETEFPALWLLVEEALAKVFHDETSEVSFERVYHTVYTLVVQDEAGRLYEKLEEFVRGKLCVLSRGETLSSQNLTAEQFLTNLLETWTRELRHFQLVADLMIYLDKVFCKLNRKLEVIDMCLQNFRDLILKPLKQQLCSSMIELLNRIHSAKGDMKKTTLFTDLINMMETAAYEKYNFFIIDFEPILLDEMKRYYENCFQDSPLDCIDLFKQISAFVFEEIILMEYLLSNSNDTFNKINHILDNVLIKGKINPILNDLIGIVFKDKSSTLLNEILQLTKSQQFQDDVIESVKMNMFNDLMSVTVDTTELRKQSMVANKFINELVDKYNSYDLILSPFEKNDNLVKNIRNDSFAKYFQKNSQPNSLYLSLFYDFNLKNVTDDATVWRLKIMVSCKFLNLIPDKDEFVQIYRQHLSKRLLQKRTDFELEKFVIKQIKDEMGGAFFTFKLENMLKDIITSDSLATTFTNHMAKNKKADSSNGGDWEFVPEILTMTAWPLQNFNNEFDKKLILPDILQDKITEFDKMYKKKYAQRIINWSHNLGLIEIGFQFNKSYHDLIMPLYSGIIFLLFRDHDELSFAQIQQLTRLPEEEVTKQLMTLSLVTRFQILCKDTAAKSISTTDKFTINCSFQSTQNPVKIQTVARTVPGRQLQQQADDRTLEKERIQVCNAAVVRVMKQGRTLTYREIFQRVGPLLPYFTLTDKIFHQSVQHLLDKEFVQLDPYETDVYHYLP